MEDFKKELDCIICDMCNECYSDSDESGGFLYRGYAYCPRCANRNIHEIKLCGEEKYITTRCRQNESFRQFILRIRKFGDDNLVKIEILSEAIMLVLNILDIEKTRYEKMNWSETEEYKILVDTIERLADYIEVK